MATKNKGKVKYEEVLRDPTSSFDVPDEVVVSEEFTTSQKLEILKRWEFDAQRLQESADEAMAGGERSQLAEVQECIRKLTSED